MFDVRNGSLLMLQGRAGQWLMEGRFGCWWKWAGSLFVCRRLEEEVEGCKTKIESLHGLDLVQRSCGQDESVRP